MEQTNQNPAQGQQKFRCPGNCMECFQSQRIYCASQHALSNMNVLDKVMETLVTMHSQMEAMNGTIQDLSARIEAIQNSEGEVFDPNAGTEDPAAVSEEFKV